MAFLLRTMRTIRRVLGVRREGGTEMILDANQVMSQRKRSRPVAPIQNWALAL